MANEEHLARFREGVKKNAPLSCVSQYDIATLPSVE
jgi:hypothetical protein